jgi:O-antigen/teichoic acid export membrane protein
MSIIRKHSIYGSIYSYLGVILGFVINLLIYPNFFTTEQVGLFTILVAYAGLLSSFAGLGINMVGIKIFPMFRDQKSKNHGFLGFVFLVNMVGFVLVSILFYVLKSLFLDSGEAGLFERYSYTIFTILFFYVLFLVFDLYYRVMYNPSIGILHKDVIQRILVIVSYMLFYFRFADFEDTVHYYVWAQILPTVLLLGFLIKDGLFHFSFDFTFLNRKRLIEIMRLNVHGILLSFASVIALRLDLIMIHQLKDLSSVGIYFVTFNIATLILIPYRTMGKVSGIVIADAYKAQDYNLIQQIASKSSITLFIAGMLLLIGIWGNVDTAFLLLKEKYYPGMYVILLIGIANLVETSIGVSSQLLFYSGMHKKLTLIMYIYLVLLVVLNLLFIPVYGIIGAAIATMLSKIIATGLKWYYIKQQIHIQVIGYRQLIVIVLGTGVYFMSQLIHLSNPYLHFIVRSTFISLAFLIPVYLLGLSEDINAWVKKIFQRLGVVH